MYPIFFGLEIHKKGIPKIYVRVFWQKKEVAYSCFAAVNSHYLILTMKVGFCYYAGYRFAGFHSLYFNISSAGSQEFFW